MAGPAPRDGARCADAPPTAAIAHRGRPPGGRPHHGVRRRHDRRARSLRAADHFARRFSQTTSGPDLRSFFAAGSEGDSDASARGLAIQSSSAWWTLTNASHAGDRNQTIIHRAFGGGCSQVERLTSAPDAEFLATDLAVDGGTTYLLVPGTGIVTHTIAPELPVACP